MCNLNALCSPFPCENHPKYQGLHSPLLAVELRQMTMLVYHKHSNIVRKKSYKSRMSKKHPSKFDYLD